MTGSNTTRSFVAFGVTVAIHADDAALFALLDQHLPAFPNAPRGSATVVYRVARVPSGSGFLVARGRRAIGECRDLNDAANLLVQDLQTTVAGRSTWTFVHAGVVGIDGHALLLPGRSGTGKSTLVAALVRAGAAYGSDEFAVLDQRGRVHPYSRCIALREGGNGVTRVDPAALGGSTLPGAVPVGAVLFMDFQPDRTLNLRPLSTAQAALRLLPHCLGVRGRPAQTLSTLREMTSAARGFVSARGEADVTARMLVSAFRSHPRP